MKYSKFFFSIHFFLFFGLNSSFILADAANCSVSSDGKTNTCSGTKTVYDQERLDYENVNITNTAWRFTVANGVEGIGLYANSKLLTANNLTVQTTNGLLGGTDAIRTNGYYAEIIVNGKLIANANGYSGDAINVTITSNATVNTGNNSEISSKQGVAVRANLSSLGSNAHNQINIGSNAIIKAFGNGTNDSSAEGYAVYAGNRDNESVAMPTGTAKVVIGTNSQISTEGNNAYAIFANKTGHVQLGNNANIITKGSQAHAIVAKDGFVTNNGNTTNFTGGTVDLLGGTTVIVDPTKKSQSIYASGAGSVVSSFNSDTNTATSGQFNVKGDMQVDRQGKIDLRMTDNSYFEGNTIISDSGSILNLNIAGANSRWQMSKSSQVTDLTLNDNSTVILGDQQVAVNPTNQVVLTVNNLSGNGNFQMRTDVIGTGQGANNIGDLLMVTGSSLGNHSVTVSDFYNGSATVDGTEKLKIIDTADGNAKFALNSIGSTAADKYVDIGAYKYYLNKGDASVGDNANAWYLSAKPTSSGGGTGNGGGSLTNTADHSINILNINYLLNYAETQTLLNRLGELHQSRENDWDFWMRGFAGKMSSFNSKLSGFDMDYHGFQAGLDRRFSIGNDDLYTGIMAGTAKANADYDVGHGNTKSYHFGVYSTYKTENDFYVDAIAKYIVMKNDFNTLTGSGHYVNGNGKTRGYTAGLETGKRFYFDKVAKSGWYLEPQTQLTYSYQGDTNIHSSNGLKTKLDDFNSLLGRASVIVGYDVKQSRTPINVYLKTGYVKEFDGKTNYSFNDNIRTRDKYKFDGSWWDNGVGINVKVNKRHNFYAEADYSTGNKFDNKSIKAGYRLEF